MKDFLRLGELLSKTEDMIPFDDNLPCFPSLLWLKRDSKVNEEMDLSKFQTKLKTMVPEKTFKHMLFCFND
jgi:hypothetical protein